MLVRTRFSSASYAYDGVFWPRAAMETENRVAFRRQRQIKVLEARTPKRLEFVFTEDALDVNADDPILCREQLEHRLGNLSVHPALGQLTPIP